MAVLLALLLLSVTAACEGAAAGPGSSYVAYEGDPGNWEAGEAIASLPCGAELVDIWSFWVDGGQSIEVLVDTLAAETAFDPTLSLMLEDPSQSGFEPTVLAEGDDEVDCSFAPSSGACPEIQVSTDASGIAYAVIGEKGVCPDSGGVYRMTAQVDGAPAPLTIEEDDNSLSEEGAGEEEHH